MRFDVGVSNRTSCAPLHFAAYHLRHAVAFVKLCSRITTSPFSYLLWMFYIHSMLLIRQGWIYWLRLVIIQIHSFYRGWTDYKTPWQTSQTQLGTRAPPCTIMIDPPVIRHYDSHYQSLREHEPIRCAKCAQLTNHMRNDSAKGS
jgi:hypothetical protein